MAQCPTEGCDEMLNVHSRRVYCYKCRAAMGRWEKRTAAEILDRQVQLVRAKFRMDHINERRLDQGMAVSQLRKTRRKGRDK